MSRRRRFFPPTVSLIPRLTSAPNPRNPVSLVHCCPATEAVQMVVGYGTGITTPVLGKHFCWSTRHTASRNSSRAWPVTSPLSCVHTPRMSMGARATCSESFDSTTSKTSKRPKVAKLCFQITLGHYLRILEATASASFLNSFGSWKASEESLLKMM